MSLNCGEFLMIAGFETNGINFGDQVILVKTPFLTLIDNKAQQTVNERRKEEEEKNRNSFKP